MEDLEERDQATLRRMVGHIHQNGPVFEEVSFLLVGETPEVKATAFLDEVGFEFFTEEGRRKAYEEFERHGWGNPIAAKAIKGSS